MKAGLGDNIHLNGGVAARVVHGASVDLRDRHIGIEQADDNVSCKKEEKGGSGQIYGKGSV